MRRAHGAILRRTASRAGAAPQEEDFTMDDLRIVSSELRAYRDGAEISGCGLRVVSVSDEASDTALVADFSLTVSFYKKQRRLMALGKAGLAQGNAAKPNGLHRKEVVSFFVSTETGEHTFAPKNFIQSEEKGYLLGGDEDVVSAANLLNEVVNGTKLQLGISGKGDAVSRIFSFTPEIEKADAQSYLACIDAFLKYAGQDSTSKGE